MPGCCVPFCVPEGRVSSLRFPLSQFLSQRWRQAIEFGSGARLAEDFDPLEAEICQQHFKEDSDGYSEPVIFHNQESGLVVHLSSCRLCLSFDYEEEILTGVSKQMMGNRAIEDILKTTLKIELNAEDDFLQGICEKCLARLDILVILKRRFVDASKAFRKMQIFIKEENRLRQTEATNGVPKKKIKTAISKQKENTGATEEETAKCKIHDLNGSVHPDGSELKNRSDDDGNNEEDDDFRDVEYLEEEMESPSEEMEDLLEESDTNPCIPGRPQDDGSQPSDAVEDLLEENEAPNEEMIDPLSSTPKNNTSKSKPTGRPKSKKSHPAIENKCPKDLADRKCYICVQEFETAKELITHLTVHVNDDNRICEICNEEFRNLMTLNRHMAKHDPKIRPFKCDHCDLRYTSKEGMHNHIRVIHHKTAKRKYPRQSFPCQHCGKKCKSMSYLIEHEGTHLGIKRHQCVVCDRKFSNKQNLDRHAIMHTNERPYKCNECEESFNHPSKYKDHLRKHTEETPFECIGCGSKFATASSLRNHKIRHHGASTDSKSLSKLRIATGSRPSNICHFCKASFVRHQLLVVHMERFHPDEQVEYYHCHICEQRFTEKEALEMHLSIHETLQCKYCDRRLLSQDGLKRHEAAHNGVKGYLCKICNKSFYCQAHFRRHERVHAGIKPHKCGFCDKKFLHLSQLRIHRRTHTGEKPYECHKCGNRFGDGSTLRKHLINVCND